MSRSICRGLVPLAVFAFSLSTSSHADTIPLATATRIVTVIGANGGSVVNTGFGPYLGLPDMIQLPYQGPPGGLFNGVGGVTATTTGSSDPSVSSALQVGGATNTTTMLDSKANVTYYFEIAGPEGTTSLNFLSSGFTMASLPHGAGTLGAEALLTVSALGSSTNALNAIACSGDTSKLQYKDCTNTPGALSSFNVNSDLELQTNTIYMVNLWSEAYFASTSTLSIPGQLESRAAVDPTITLVTSDPAYSLSFSSNLTPDPTTTTPEPGTLLLCLPGIATGLACLRLRRA